MIEFLTTTNINALYPKNVALYCNVKGGLLTTAHIGSAMTNIILSKQLPIGARAQQYFGGFRILGTLYLFGITASALSDICGCNVVGRGLATASFCLLKPFELAQNVTNLVTAVPERMRLGYTAPITVATNLLSGQGLRITDIKECKQAINSALSMFK